MGIIAALTGAIAGVGVSQSFWGTQWGNSGHYYNWDETKFRRLWAKDPASVIPEEEQAKKPLIVLKEAGLSNDN
jgi:hypothetical protein